MPKSRVLLIRLLVIVVMNITGAVVQAAPAAQEPPPEEPAIRPVAMMIASFFDVEASEVMELRDADVGYGIIATAYFLAQSEYADGLTAAQIIALKGEDEEGPGWGQVIKELSGGKPPGQVMRRMNLGRIMGGKGKGKGHNKEGKPETPPGQEGKGESKTPLGQAKGKTKTPPGQAKKGDGDGQGKGEDQ